MSTDDVPLKAAKTTFEIINELLELEGAGVSELADQLGKPTSTIHDYLRTLTDEGYLVKEGNTYYVGTKFLELGGRVRSRMNVYNVARSEVEDLAEKTGEHANLLTEEHGMGVLLYRAHGPNAVKLDTHAGMRLPLNMTAHGKALLSMRPHEEVEAIIDRHGLPAATENTITDRAEFLDELEVIRKRGYAIDDEERVAGMRCIAAPITDENGRGIAGLSISGPKSRMTGDRFTEELPTLLMQSVNVIEVNITYS